MENVVIWLIIICIIGIFVLSFYKAYQNNKKEKERKERLEIEREYEKSQKERLNIERLEREKIKKPKREKFDFETANQKNIQGYIEHGMKQYQILGANDSKTCDLCKKMNGKIYNVDEAGLGNNIPPFHDGCRCTTIAFFED